MSLEQLLVFLLVVAIPLFERLIRAMRARTVRSPGERGAAAEATVSRPQPPLPVPDPGGTAPAGRRTDLLPPPALRQAVRDAAPEQLRASELELRVRRERQHPRTGDPARPVRPGTPLQRVIAGADLRSAIVLMTILGPCRAVEPKGASQLD